MEYEFYVTVEGTKQGRFKHPARQEKYKDKIPGVAFQYNVTSPRDPASGEASGKRIHHPVTFVKEWAATTPQFFQALCSNESLSSVLFEFVKVETKSGLEHTYHTIKLVNASVCEIDQYLVGDDPQDRFGVPELEKISLTFERIELENIDGKTMAADDWTTVS